MTKTFKSTSDVKQAREEGKSVVFNIQVAALKAEATPAGTTARSNSGALRTNILAIYENLKTPLSVNQVFEGLQAGGMTTVTRKQVSDKLWGMAKCGVLKKGAETGMYELA